MADEEDPKAVARAELRTPMAQSLLRQFMQTDGPKGVTQEYRDGWDRIFGEKPALLRSLAATLKPAFDACPECRGLGDWFVDDELRVCELCDGSGRAPGYDANGSPTTET